jgi:uncharacterized DUF497 family protein
MNLQFEWDNHKAALNLKKHGVSFVESQTVFNDSLACIFDDERHSIGERREIIIGHSKQQRLLLVFFTQRTESIIRLFSSRLATQKERRDYENGTKF